MKIYFILFDGFETLDLFGPVEILARQESHELYYCSLTGGTIYSAQKTPIDTVPFKEIESDGVIVLPGGRGTRNLVNNEEFLLHLKEISKQATYCLSICTGSALLGQAGILDGRQATSNKSAFDWVMSTSEKVQWQKQARWVVDGKFYTSSGVSAGMDMALGFMADRYGIEVARKIAKDIEYVWNEDSKNDPFARKD
ncbi:DJ-1/PfpI family protein [Anaerosporobacter faecicola]|uniref:DJ-1/PfpI family protein n=1 Tax=Anaerosporobacter faecicola TaxID=2718714 RepID=UPI00143AAACB|nr:DJ-1/PfpI family protein [Anaerosporobacter faecicola]